MPMQVRGTAAPNSPPTGLAERQLSVEMGSSPPKLWCGVPASIDPVNGRVQISPPVDYVSTSALATALSTFQQSVTQVTPTAGGQVMFVQNDNVLRANPQLVLYDGGQAGMVMQTANNVAASGDYVTLLRSRGTLALPTAVASGDQLGSVNFGGFPHVAGQLASITVWTTQPWTAANKGCWMDLSVIANNTNINATTLQLSQSGAISMPRVTPTRITDGGAGMAQMVVMGADGVLRRNVQVNVSDWATTMPGGSECGLELNSYMGTQWNMASYIQLRNSRGTQATRTATMNGDVLGFLEMLGWPVGTAGDAGGTSIFTIATENHTATAKGAELIVGATALGSTPMRHTLRSRALPNGSELHLCMANGFYTTAGSPNVSPAQIWWILQASGATDTANTNLYIGQSTDASWNGLWFTKLAGVQTPNQYSWWLGGNITATGTITPGCDERDKEDIEDVSAGLDEVRRLRSRRWRRAGMQQAGLVAQEVEGIIPEAVVTRRHPRLDADPEARLERPDYKFLDPMAIIAALINSVKSLSDRVAVLEVAHG